MVEFELTKEFIERFQRALDERDDEFIKKTLGDVKAADITALLYEFNSEESKYVMDLLSIEVQAEIISEKQSVRWKRMLAVMRAVASRPCRNHPHDLSRGR